MAQRRQQQPASIGGSLLIVLAIVAGIVLTCKAQSDEKEYREKSKAETQARKLKEQSEKKYATPYKPYTSTTANCYDDAPSSTLPDGMEIPKYNTSRGGQVIAHLGYTVSYDADFKTPQWVAWELTSAKANGTEERYNKFQPDPDVRGAKAYPKDYTNSGYDRGHMAPAADMKWSHQAMVESFYMTNVCPQNRNLNRGDWKDLEEKEREYANRYGTVSIVAGPLYYTSKPERIGTHRVAVPDAFFKVMLVGYPKHTKAYGFIFRNQAGSHSLNYYQTTVDEVERVTGMDFFSKLPDKVEKRVEAEKPAL